MYFIYPLLAIAIVLLIRLLRAFLTKFLYDKFQIVCIFKALFGIREFRVKKKLKDLIAKKFSLKIFSLRIRYISGFKFQIQIDRIDHVITYELIEIELIKSFISEKEKIAYFLYNVLKLRSNLNRLCDR